jgi:hypothetical protein
MFLFHIPMSQKKANVLIRLSPLRAQNRLPVTFDRRGTECYYGQLAEHKQGKTSPTSIAWLTPARNVTALGSKEGDLLAVFVPTV